MKPFKHIDAKTINGAIKLQSKGKAKLIAGGTDLLGILKDRILPEYPETVINIKTIPRLDYIREDAGGLKIGALTKLEDIARSPIIREKYKILAEAAEAVATPHIRTMGTLGGNLCQDVRCWYYRSPNQIGGRIDCYLKGGKECYALTGENQYHSIFGGLRVAAPPCQSACPGHVNIPAYLSQIREGNLLEAARVLLQNNPIPAITGRVCPHFCEQSCNRRNFDESLSIRDIERFVGDYILDRADEVIEKPAQSTRKKVAIIGSGPAGLAAAYYLRLAGHRVTVFDRMEEAGGLLRYVIPSYRLPKDIVRRTVKMLENIGIEFRLKVDIGKDVTIENLKKDYDAVFIAEEVVNNSRGLIVAHHETQITSVPGIFAGGAVARGPATVIEAVADGKRAAVAMEAYLMKAGSGQGNAAGPLLKFNAEYYKKTKKLKASGIPVKKRTIDIEDTPGFGLDQIKTEANRCFNCSCLSVNASDTGVALEALNAMVKIVGTGGTRTIPVAEFFGSFPNALEKGDVVMEIQVPPVRDNARQTFVKFRLREAIDFALVSVASVISLENDICQDARIVLGAVAPRPLRATSAEKVLVGRALDDEQAAAAAEAALEDALPLEKNSYKIPIAREMVRRAIVNAGTSGK